MVLPTYSYYTETYKGLDITDERTYNSIIRKAGAYFSKLDRMWTLVYTDDNKDLGLCAMCEVFNSYHELGNISSESDGSYSVTYNKTKFSNLDDSLISELSIYVDIYRRARC